MLVLTAGLLCGLFLVDTSGGTIHIIVTRLGASLQETYVEDNLKTVMQIMLIFFRCVPCKRIIQR